MSKKNEIVNRPDPRPDFLGGDQKTLLGQGIRTVKENAGDIASKAVRAGVKAISKTESRKKRCNQVSEKDKHEAALRRGRNDYYKGVPRDKCPLTALDSRMDWFEAWDKTKKFSDSVHRQFNGKPHICISCGGPAIGSKICTNCLGS